MLIGSCLHIRYATFIGALAPVAIVGLAIDAALLLWFFRDDLHPGPFEFEGRRRGRCIGR